MYRACTSAFWAGVLLLLLSACGSAPLREERVAADAAADDATQALIPEAAVRELERALSLAGAEDVAGAEAALRALAEQYPQYAGPLVNLGILLARTDRLEEAHAALEQAVQRNPDHAAAFNQLGIVNRRLGRFEEARAAYREALRADPGHANAWLNLGVLCDLYLQQPQRALEAFERYLQLVPDEKVNGWVRELRTRVGASERSASVQP